MKNIIFFPTGKEEQEWVTFYSKTEAICFIRNSPEFCDFSEEAIERSILPGFTVLHEEKKVYTLPYIWQ